MSGSWGVICGKDSDIGEKNIMRLGLEHRLYTNFIGESDGPIILEINHQDLIENNRRKVIKTVTERPK